MNSVALLGSPRPLLSTYAWVKYCDAPINEMTRSYSSTGDMSGIVIRRNDCQRFAPSILTASYSSVGTDWSPAMLMIMKLPMAHRPINDNEARIHGSALIQSGPVIPNMPRNAFSQPVLVFRKPSQTSV